MCAVSVITDYYAQRPAIAWDRGSFGEFQGEDPVEETLPEDGDAPDEIIEEPTDDDVGEPSDTEEDD